MRIKVHEKNTEAFGSVDDMLTKDEQKIVLDAYSDALKEALTYIQGALPEGYTPTQLAFGNPFYTSIGTERPDLDRYDPDRFGPHLFNISVDFIDGDSPKVAFRVDTVDRMVRNAGKAYTALLDKPAFPVLDTNVPEQTTVNT